MRGAAYPSLLRWTLMNIGWGTTTRAHDAASPMRSASTRAGLRIPPSSRSSGSPSVRGRPYGRPPRRSVVVPVWLPGRLPVCSRQASRAVTILRTRTVNRIHCPCLRHSRPVMGPSQGPLPGERMQRMHRGLPARPSVKLGTVKCPVCRVPNRTSWDLSGTNSRFLRAETYGPAFIFSPGQIGHKRILYGPLPGFSRMHRGDEPDIPPKLVRHGQIRGKVQIGGKGRRRNPALPVALCQALPCQPVPPTLNLYLRVAPPKILENHYHQVLARAREFPHRPPSTDLLL
jgi:hypothetical protein